jgi:hypothetical protein
MGSVNMKATVTAAATEDQRNREIFLCPQNRKNSKWPLRPRWPIYFLWRRAAQQSAPQ